LLLFVVHLHSPWKCPTFSTYDWGESRKGIFEDVEYLAVFLFFIFSSSLRLQLSELQLAVRTRTAGAEQ